MQSEIIIYILFVLFLSVQSLTHIDEVILRCQQQCEEFAKTEEKYLPNDKIPRNESDLTGGNIADSQLLKMRMTLYEKQKLQRPFECIANNLDPYSLRLVQSNLHYQELVRKCKSQPQPQCDASTLMYRTLDGTCNNLVDRTRGSSFRCLRRLLKARYEGISGFRQSVYKTPLKDARDISLFLNKELDRPNKCSTLMTPFFGQFVAHDMTDVPKICIGKGEPACDIFLPENHPECKINRLKKNDPLFTDEKPQFKDKRTAICDTCSSLEKRVQMNFQTSYLDLSHVYGLLKSESDAVRTLDGTGRLLIQKNKRGRDILPASFEELDRCGYAQKEQYCFKSGDRRVNQNSPLTFMHTLFHIEHNRIAKELKRLNAHWSDEKIFQEARKINIAEYQIIIYKEYLPFLLPPDIINKYKLKITNGYSKYDSSQDATQLVEFNTAAFRLHSTVGSVISNGHGKGHETLLKNQSFEVSSLYSGEWESLLEGMSLTRAQNFDTFVVEDISKQMYRRPTGVIGYDIFTSNIDRGRDNGLPTYVEMVKAFSNGKINIKNFRDLEVLIDKVNIQKLRKVYRDVRDIDLIVGLWNERVPPKSLVGPTNAEIIGKQFSDVKYGDRFYVENIGNFNKEQLQSLKSVTLSNILCSNIEMESIQKNALKLKCRKNSVLQCDDIPKVNLNLWKEVPLI